MARIRLAALVSLSVVSLAPALRAQTPALDLAEAYALAGDRDQVVRTLLAGSEEAYLYTVRELQDRGELGAVAPLLAAWTERYGRTPAVLEAENRQALLGFARDPQATFAFLRQRLGLRFDDAPADAGEPGALPTRLPPELLTREAWSQRARAAYPNSLGGFGAPALFWLAQGELDDGSLRELLTRLERPDVPGLAALVVRELALPTSRTFGLLPLHLRLRLEQLEECARLQPELLKEPRFVGAWLERLAPSADAAWLHEPAERKDHLVRLWDFVRRLPPVHNSLKAHVLYHFLAFDLSRGEVDGERLREYLRLPRRAGHVVPLYRDRFERREQVDPAQEYATGLAPIGDDEPLLRACLEQVFARSERLEPWSEYLDADWLRVVLAETRLVNGDADAARWSAMLGGGARVEALAQRVELDFVPSAQKLYAAAAPVVLEVDVKNVPTLLVKVFAVDAFRYHVARDREVDETLELDGLVANSEQTFRYQEPPMRRVRRRFELPLLSQPGTYVIELVGNGLRSRAVIQKGSLHHVETPGAAGHVFTVFDEAGTKLADASVWLGGRDYAADARGEILVPYSTDPAVRTVVLHHVVPNQGELSTRASFLQHREEYALRAASHVEREALLAGARARLLVRPELLLADRPLALSLLQEPVLTLVATDLDGLSTTQEVRGLALVDERELVHELGVPERLTTLAVGLRGFVTDLAGERVELASATTTFRVNGIDATSATACPQLLRTSAGYALELRGKDGEPRAGRALALTLRARDFTDPLSVQLQTDAQGRIELGALEGVQSVGLTYGESSSEVRLREAACSYPRRLHGLVGETLRVPYAGLETAPTRAAFSLLGHEHDAFEHLALADGFLELRDLAAGDYELALFESGTQVEVRVTQGVARAGWRMGRERMLEPSGAAPLAIRRLELAADELRVQLANPSRSTRLTVVATRYLPAFEPFESLRGASAALPRALDVPPAQSTYHAGLALGDEYRYVLERRFAPKYPGNMLARPSWLLNPLDLDEVIGHYGTGAPSAFASRRGRGGMGQGGGGGKGGAARGPGEALGPAPGVLANLDYLPAPATTLANLVPDADGLVRVPLAELGAGSLVHVLALDGAQAVYRTLARPETPLVPRARHLVAALDEREHSLEQRRIEFVPAGGTTVLDAARTTKSARLDSLAAVRRLFLSISGDADLARFEFVVRWPSLSRTEQLELYARHACHELHFFLYQKDPAFFGEVVRPYLANKLDKTFLDHWLLGDDLSAYLEPFPFGRLNLIERILLARRVAQPERAALVRAVGEAHALLAPDRARQQRLFELALSNDALAAEAPEKKAAGEPPAEKAADRSAPGAPGDAAAMSVATGEAPELEEELADARTEDAERRKSVRRLYRTVEPTRRLIEHDYWHRAPLADDSFAALVPASAFWDDFARADPAQPFVSTAVAEASTSFLEMMFALSVLDLPFAAGEAALQGTTLTAKTPLLLVRKETAPVRAGGASTPLLLGENFLRLDARTELVDGETRDRFVTGEFLSDVPYACQVVVTNPTSAPRAVELLLQIPAGALPVQKGFWTRGQSLALGPYSTQALEYAFYFPRSGDYAHYPVHAAEKETLAGAAAPRTLHVVDRPTQVDASSWAHLARHGTPAEVFAHLDGANLQQLDLSLVAWRLREREFFTPLVERLRTRHRYDDKSWSYGLYHGDERTAREYLEHQDAFVATCGAYLDSPLVRIDPLARATYLYVELDPLVHARAHHRGRMNFEPSADLGRLYGALLDVLGHKPALEAEDWARVTTYLLLQDRVDDALAAYAKIDAARLDSRLQYDYLGAYLCFFTGDVKRARALAEPYRAHPVERWRERFGAVLAQLDEAAGKRTTPDGTPSQDQLAASEPALELAGEGRALVVRYRNLGQCEVRWYPLDVEVAFSAKPFAPSEGQASAFVQPLLARSVALPADKSELALELPAQFSTANVLVEVRAGGQTRARTLFANALDVRFLEAYGQVVVAAPKSGAPLPRVYVKCFARLPDGTVRFHKDGYTDLRGRFDYASISDDPDLDAERFAVLVLSDELGADLRELAPPAR